MTNDKIDKLGLTITKTKPKLDRPNLIATLQLTPPPSNKLPPSKDPFKNIIQPHDLKKFDLSIFI